MSEADLEQIRRARLQQLQEQQQGSGGASAGSPEQHSQEQQREQEAQARAHILAQILTPEAADRLGRIRMVKESRATDVENRLIMLARSGQLKEKVSEIQLKSILGAVADQSHEQEKIVVRRTKGRWDEDDDDLDALLDI